MTALMTLPAEIRLQVWRECVPPELEIDIVAYLIESSNHLSSVTPHSCPDNPAVSPLLLNHHTNAEVSALPAPTLFARIPLYSFEDWFESCVKPRRSLFGRIGVFGMDAHQVDAGQHYDARRRTLENTERLRLLQWFHDVQLVDVISTSTPKRKRVRVDYEMVFKVARPSK